MDERASGLDRPRGRKHRLERSVLRGTVGREREGFRGGRPHSLRVHLRQAESNSPTKMVAQPEHLLERREGEADATTSVGLRHRWEELPTKKRSINRPIDKRTW